MDDDFEALVRARYESLRRAAFVLCGDVHAADDLVQNTLVKAMRHWRRVRSAENVDAYLSKTLLLTHRSTLRRRWRGEVPHEDPAAHRSAPAAADGFGAVLERQSLRPALAQLSGAHREILVMRFMADWSEAQCAAALGCSAGTVKSRTSRALAALREAGAFTDPAYPPSRRPCP